MEVPPPTRGWPQARFLEPHTQPGSPAHAGMAPPPPSLHIAGRGFPRPRGDGPPESFWQKKNKPVPPPTRG